MQKDRFREVIKQLIRTDIVNYKHYKTLERKGLERHGDLYPLMEIIFEFLDLETRSDREVDIITQAYFNKCREVLEIPLEPDYYVDLLVEKLYEMLLVYKYQRSEKKKQKEEVAGRHFRLRLQAAFGNCTVHSAVEDLAALHHTIPEQFRLASFPPPPGR